MSGELRDALTAPDSAALIWSAQVVDVAADGTVTIDSGAGPIPATIVLGSYTPIIGDTVQVMKRDPSSWLVLGSIRTANATTQLFSRSWGVPWSVMPDPVAVGAGSGTLTINPIGTGSWRSADGWSAVAPYQGAWNAQLGLLRGCYFYGSQVAGIAGRTCTSLTIRLHRSHGPGAGGVGSGGAVRQWIAPHGNPTQPSGPPTFTAGAINVGSLTAPDDLQVGTFVLPVRWGQALIDGSSRGLGHLSASAGDYQRCRTLAEDPASGQLAIGWT